VLGSVADRVTEAGTALSHGRRITPPSTTSRCEIIRGHPVLAVDLAGGARRTRGLTPDGGPAIKPRPVCGRPRWTSTLQLTVNGEVRQPREQPPNSSSRSRSRSRRSVKNRAFAPRRLADGLARPLERLADTAKGYLPPTVITWWARVGGVASLANTVWPTADIREPTVLPARKRWPADLCRPVSRSRRPLLRKSNHGSKPTCSRTLPPRRSSRCRTSAGKRDFHDQLLGLVSHHPMTPASVFLGSAGITGAVRGASTQKRTRKRLDLIAFGTSSQTHVDTLAERLPRRRARPSSPDPMR